MWLTNSCHSRSICGRIVSLPGVNITPDKTSWSLGNMNVTLEPSAPLMFYVSLTMWGWDLSSSSSSHLPVTHGLMTVSSSMDCGNIDGAVAHHVHASMEDHLSTFLGTPSLTAATCSVLAPSLTHSQVTVWNVLQIPILSFLMVWYRWYHSLQFRWSLYTKSTAAWQVLNVGGIQTWITVLRNKLGYMMIF